MFYFTDTIESFHDYLSLSLYKTSCGKCVYETFVQILFVHLVLIFFTKNGFKWFGFKERVQSFYDLQLLSLVYY